MKYPEQKMKYLTAIYLVIVIIAVFFMLFIFPLMFDEYRENSLLTIIIMFSVFLWSTEELVKKIRKSENQKHRR